MARGTFCLAALLWLVIAFFVVYPLSVLLLESFKIAETGGWGIANYLGFFQETYYLKIFGNNSGCRWHIFWQDTGNGARRFSPPSSFCR